MLYRIQQKAGKAFAEMKPYSLFPVCEYFEVEIGREAPAPLTPKRPAGKGRPLVLPLSA